MSPKHAKKFVKFSKYLKGKLHNGVFCSCRQCNKGDQTKHWIKFKLKGEYYDRHR
jgi:hypothetical protein